jgi:hypothetical protein
MPITTFFSSWNIRAVDSVSLVRNVRLHMQRSMCFNFVGRSFASLGRKGLQSFLNQVYRSKHMPFSYESEFVERSSTVPDSDDTDLLDECDLLFHTCLFAPSCVGLYSSLQVHRICMETIYGHVR